METSKKNSKALIIVLSIIGVLFVITICFFGWLFGVKNSIVSKEEIVSSSWAQVQNQYQRRYDLIPNLVETVKGYANQEKETFTQVTEARGKASSFQITEEVLNNPESFKKFEALQGELSSALSRLMAVSENYPQLKSNENFLELQSQLEGTENRISVERNRYNESIKQYNTFIKLFPQSFVASMFGFDAKPYFEASIESQTAPKVQF
ncbi:MAG: LemA family protein [Patescibacteria group bacterium]